MMYSEAYGTPKWQCPWALEIMGLEVSREGWNEDMDQEVIHIHIEFEILGEEELTNRVCT